MDLLYHLEAGSGTFAARWACMHVRVRVRVCACVHAQRNHCMLRARACTHGQTCVRACVRACVCTGAWALLAVGCVRLYFVIYIFTGAMYFMNIALAVCHHDRPDYIPALHRPLPTAPLARGV